MMMIMVTKIGKMIQKPKVMMKMMSNSSVIINPLLKIKNNFKKLNKMKIQVKTKMMNFSQPLLNNSFLQ